ncbi:MAG: bifunctional diaminohydroxyphosphoribosylaminopyrimidine deaminase/5-amino-6-(5-phosphoribosylamino)uracil reductase RibD [Chlorobi bacterium]|nr:MAG: pyrimidine deaminase [Chlorobi bacterium OLB7]MBK8912301.1 bifunctional diaminohydroxyphosphoribosylaminopyrimidine deaminase/5-amino-6-(5-phosphoribosylamino)uracil reductase RibD [Chlorobiota bacterium]
MQHTMIDIEERDDTMMRRALTIATRGQGLVSPNPMVGAVIADANGRIVAEGAHEQYGGPHAEVVVLRNVPEGTDLSSATLYVTLEPCNHHGKTPPCTEAIIASGIRRVVVAMRDPNPIVSGQGNKRLREAGIEVVVGVHEADAKRLNEAYIHFIKTGSPFITLKVAQTLDGFIALPNGESQWITGLLAREHTHRLRAMNDAVMIGAGTALHDNPSLTVRFDIAGRNPKRVVLDENLHLPDTLQMFTDEFRTNTIVFTDLDHLETDKARLLQATGVTVYGANRTTKGLHLNEVFATLGDHGIASVMVEGGAQLAESLMREGLVHKLNLFIAPKMFGHGISPFRGLAVEHVDQAYHFTIYKTEMIGEDMMLTAYLK